MKRLVEPMLGWLLPEEPASRRVYCQESIEILRLVEINGVEHGGACMGQCRLSESANFSVITCLPGECVLFLYSAKMQDTVIYC